MKYRMALAGLIISIVPLISNANFQTGKIEKLLIHDNDAGEQYIDVKLSPASEGEMAWCNSTLKEWATDAHNNDFAKLQFSMLLAAYMAGKEITIYSDGVKKCVNTNRNRIRNIEVK